MIESTALLENAIERILDMSANLQIKRMATTQYSLEFHEHSVAIAAYGRVLAILTRLQHQEECSAPLALLGALQTSQASSAVLPLDAQRSAC